MAGLLFWKKKCREVRFEGVQRGFLSERKGKTENRKGAGTNSGQFGVRNREDESRILCEEPLGCEYQKQSGEYGRVCKVEDSHRDKTEQCA